MKFLTSAQIDTWYNVSIHYSGYDSLSEWCVEIWKTLVEQGYNSIPPGFIASVLEHLTHQKTGKNKTKNDNFETTLMNLIVSNNEFIQLEGQFLLKSKRDGNQYIVILRRIIENLGNFYHPEIVFLSSQFETDKENEENQNDKTNFLFIIKTLYQNAISQAVKLNTILNTEDIFEIFHPDLFETPTSRSLFRKMIQTKMDIREYVAGELNLKKENAEMAAVFGEPESLPVGGYDSITRKGEMTSLVPSELVYIEEGQDIDYFDYKYIQKELMYFKREEGIIYRIRRRIYLHIVLQHEVEHQRNLADTFAFCLVVCEKIFATFIKDVIDIEIYFSDYLPSEIEEAILFLQHYLKEGNYDSKVHIYTKKTIEIQEEVKRFQNWYIGPKENIVGIDKNIRFSFPFLNKIQLKDRGIFLADTIDYLLDEMIAIAHY